MQVMRLFPECFLNARIFVWPETRNTPTAGYYEISPTQLPDPTFEFPMEHPSDGISMEVVSKFMGRRTVYKIQFVAPAIVRYYFPKCAPGNLWQTALPAMRPVAASL
jgi:hypothetical protein